jgi:hypothetical protein
MQTADWALVISIISLGIAAASFVWNVWSKFIYPKPVVRVSFSMVKRGSDDVLRLDVTNMGPIDVTLMEPLVWYNHGPFKDKKYSTFYVLPRAPLLADLDREFRNRGGLAEGFPKRLKVGESWSVYLVPDHEMLARGDYEGIGFRDAFRRCHWAPRRDILEALPSIRSACESSGKNWRAKQQ